MLEIFLYSIGVMYSPGPVNILAFNEGLKGNFFNSMGFFSGVGSAMLILCIALGYLGETIIEESILPYLAMIGCCYITYLSYKIFKATKHLDINQGEQGSNQASLSFSNGLLMQLLNPKAMLALIPVTTIMFPAANVTGASIIAYALAIGVLAMWAPGSYSFVGSLIHKRGLSTQFLKGFNYLMVILLLFSAFMILYENVILKIL